MINILKQKDNFRKFYNFLTKKNKNYDFFRNELYFNLIYKKNNFLNIFFALIRDFFVLIGNVKILKNKQIFFFTLPTQSGYKIFENLPFYNKKNLIKVPLTRNKNIKCANLNYMPSKEFFKFFFKVITLIEWSKSDGIIILIYSIRLSLLVTIWKFYLEQSNQKNIKIYLHNDFDIYNAALLFLIKFKLIKKSKINVFCLQHGISTEEFFPTKTPNYYVWSRKILKLFKIKNASANESKLKVLKSKKIFKRNKICRNRYLLDKNLNFVSQGHTKIYGKNARKSLINFFNELSKLPIDSHCLLHPSEKKSDNIYKAKHSKNIHEFPHNFAYKNKIKIYLCFCSTAMIKIMQNNHIVVGLNIKVGQSKETYKCFKPPLTIKKPNEILSIFNRLEKDEFYYYKLIKKQRKYLEKILGSN